MNGWWWRSEMSNELPKLIKEIPNRHKHDMHPNLSRENRRLPPHVGFRIRITLFWIRITMRIMSRMWLVTISNLNLDICQPVAVQQKTLEMASRPTLLRSAIRHWSGYVTRYVDIQIYHLGIAVRRSLMKNSKRRQTQTGRKMPFKMILFRLSLVYVRRVSCCFYTCIGSILIGIDALRSCSHVTVISRSSSSCWNRRDGSKVNFNLCL